MIDDVVAFLCERLGDSVVFDVPLGAKTTYRVGGNASAAVRIDSDEQLTRVVSAVTDARAAGFGIDVVVLGNGSNMLVADAGFDGLAIQLHPAYCADIVPIDQGVSARVLVGGAAALPVAARRISRMGLSGFEWAVGVPGSLGGAIKMNAGGHGSDMAASVVRVRLVNVYGTRGADPVWVTADQLAFGYRSSALIDGDLVLDVELALLPGDPDKSAEILDEIVAWRRANQPGGQNCGSVFANPEGDSAGRLIDEAGLAGFRIGTAQVSDRHANFIQADPGGRAADVLAVITAVQDTIRKMYGIELRPEVRLVGHRLDA